MSASSALAQDVARAFRYLLSSQGVCAKDGVEMARLMLELASAHQLEAQLMAMPGSQETRQHLEECRLRATQASARLGLGAPASFSTP